MGFLAEVGRVINGFFYSFFIFPVVQLFVGLITTTMGYLATLWGSKNSLGERFSIINATDIDIPQAKTYNPTPPASKRQQEWDHRLCLGVAAALVYEAPSFIEHQLGKRYPQLAFVTAGASDFESVGGLQCFLEFHPKSKKLTISFRGTRPTSVTDWATDFKMRLGSLPAGIYPTQLRAQHSALLKLIRDSATKKKDRDNNNTSQHTKRADRLQNFVAAQQNQNEAQQLLQALDDAHGGFTNLIIRNFETIEDGIDMMVATHDVQSLSITGHSLGAALAVVFSVVHNFTNRSLPVDVAVFGCPRLGGQKWNNTVDFKIGREKLHSIVYEHDVVPRVPGCTGIWKPFRYQPNAGTLWQLVPDGNGGWDARHLAGGYADQFSFGDLFVRVPAAVVGALVILVVSRIFGSVCKSILLVKKRTVPAAWGGVPTQYHLWEMMKFLLVKTLLVKWLDLEIFHRLIRVNL
eukprot:TRINITY_DN55950_c0_g1_i1.p1 TRINITY_DN55950_c0_g1~~TRINITY_DN55950_c0_g1_i1.p1  ORF type:complete len:463 (+),score=48.00 TRINITY_DN55950_c0_g1_i1:36-1424(+)